MGKRYFVIMAVIGIAILLVTAGIHAASDENAKGECVECVPGVAERGVADVIKMKEPAYVEHLRGIHMFPHFMHVEELTIGCGDCHHDAAGKPLVDLAWGDPAQRCIECHSIASLAPRPEPGEPRLTREEKLAYHAEAVHMQCIDCHRAHNRKVGERVAPVTCGACHPKDCPWLGN